MRGKKSPIGTERVSANGYHYIKTEDGWRLKHHLVIEEHMGRSLKANERVYFKDADRTNFDPGNLEVRTVKSKEEKMAEIENKIAILQDELEELKSS